MAIAPMQHLASPPSANERSVRRIRSLLRSGWYGSVTLHIKDGHITALREERLFQANEIPPPETQESSGPMSV